MKIYPVYSDYNGCMTYTVVDENSKKAVLVDAGQPFEVIKRILQKEEVTCEAILLTHGHYDHINYIEEIKAATSCDVYVHTDDAEKLSNPIKNVSYLFSENFSLNVPAKTVSDGDVIEIGNLKFTVIHTPGHTEGSVCYHCKENGDEVLFSGDTLFRNSIGRWDFPGGNKETLLKSINMLCCRFPKETPVFSGHGESTTIGTEMASNVFLRSDW